MVRWHSAPCLRGALSIPTMYPALANQEPPVELASILQTFEDERRESSDPIALALIVYVTPSPR